jgi:protoporphyrin/coproporphyrin ferrochelatase
VSRQARAATPPTAVLMIAFGGPTRAEEIRPFLQNVAAGRPIPPSRIEEVAHHYEKMGGRSPLNELTMRQAQALERALAAAGPPLPVYVGMRNWHPLLAETLAAMRERGVRRALGVILSAHDSEAGWQRYVEDVADARRKIERAGGDPPEVVFAPNWHAEPLFIAAQAARVEAALGEIPPARRRDVPLVFTAHSIPEVMAARSAYVEQYERSSRLVAERLGHARWLLAYQSRSGRPQDPWLEPDVNRVIETLAAEGVREVVLAPIGFVCDHVEVLYDLDQEARATAERAGVRYLRAATVGDHPAFIEMLASLVRRACSARDDGEAAR